MYTKTSFVGLAICVYVCLFVAGSESKELVAMDYIIKANMGKEKQMNVHKFDIRLPSFRSGAGAGQLDAAARDETRLWRGGVVPYVIHQSIRERPMYQANLEKAMKEWETYTCINFREKKKKDRDFVVFAYGTGCNADVGRKGRRQYVSLGKGCSDTSVIIHEIGHVVGFWHEQNRPDRNKYVEIIWKNIINNYKFAFSEYTNTRINSRNVTYDYESIMHYGNYAFSKNSKATIQAKNSAVKVFGNKHLSPLDIKQANLVYNCPVKESMFPKFPEDFVFSMNGALPKKHCVLITEPRKVRQRPGWLCHNRTARDAAIKWSHNGKIANMDCTRISSPFGEDRKGLWRDNYLCVANDSVYKFHWAKKQPIAGLGCLQWPIKKGQKNKTSFLCAKFVSGPIDGGWSMWSPWTKCSRECGGGYQEQRRYCTNPEPKNYGKTCYGQDYRRQFCNRQKCSEYPTWPDDFWFRYYKYTPYEENCLRIYNRDAGLYWKNYYFCSLGHKRRINMKWSDMGSQPGMICTKVREPKEQDMWDNKYLCVPHNSQYRFQWSYSGPISGLQCVQWLAKNGTSGWDNNYLCAGKVTPKINDEGVASLAVSAVVDGGWSRWTAWSRCSKTCDRGYQTRSRSCTEPTPSRDGKRCSGRGRDMSSCTITDCPNPCIGTYTGDKGKLISPSFPNYPKNSKCHWKITVPQGKRVEMKFTYMRLKAQRSKCSSDSLVVRDGDNSKAAFLKRFCQNTMATQSIQSTGNTMFLELQTTNALHTGGFKAEWTSKDIPKKATCGGTLRGLNGTFTSPLYPAKYPDNTECTWSITVPLDRVLTVKFLSFYMESHKECSYDKLEIFDGGTISAPKKIYCGRKIPGALTAFTNRLLIKFKSDGSRNYDGFKISWVTKKRTFT